MEPILKKVVDYSENGLAVCLCIVINTEGAVPRHAGSKMLVFLDGRTEGTVGGGGVEEETRRAALDSLKDGKTRLVTHDLNADNAGSAGTCGGRVTVYVEPQITRPTLLILGAGHVGRSVARLAQQLQFRVVVTDDRAELCNREDFPGDVEFLVMPLSEVPSKLSINQQTYIVGVTRGSDVDIEGLPAILGTEPAYLGLIGSLRRWDHTRRVLLENGLPEEKLQKVKTPIGLNIKAETPDEIAVSILAEVIMAKNSR